MRIMDCVLILFRKRVDPVVFDAERNCVKPSWSESLKVWISVVVAEYWRYCSLPDLYTSWRDLKSYNNRFWEICSTQTTVRFYRKVRQDKKSTIVNLWRIFRNFLFSFYAGFAFSAKGSRTFESSYRLTFCAPVAHKAIFSGRRCYLFSHTGASIQNNNNNKLVVRFVCYSNVFTHASTDNSYVTNSEEGSLCIQFPQNLLS